MNTQRVYIQEVRDKIARHLRSRRRNRRYFRESTYWRTQGEREQDKVAREINGTIWAILELAREEFPK